MSAIVAAVVVMVLVALWVADKRRTEKPVPVGIPMQITSAEGWEGEPAISPDGTRVAYVSTVSGNSDVYVTDVLGGRVLQLTGDPSMDFTPTWFPDGAAIAFTSDRTGIRSVWKVGRFGGGATMLIEDGEYPAISPDGTRIAFSRTNDSSMRRIWVASLDNPSDAKALTTGTLGPLDHVTPAWSPGGRFICYSSRSSLWVIPARGGSARQLTKDGRSDRQPAWSSDGRYIYFDSWREGTLALWRVPSRGGESQRMTQGTGYESEPRVSVDGSRFVYSAGNLGSGAVLVDLETGRQTTIGRMRRILMASISPDGSRMVFTSERWGRHTELAEQLLDDGVPSGPPRRLTDQEGNASHPFYSPDGRWIAYYLVREQGTNIWIISAEGGRPNQFTSGTGMDVHPSWSPTGDMLAFASRQAETYDVWVAPVREGSRVGEPREITDGSVQAISPVWSPDGSEIAFVGWANERREIWVVPSDGSEPASPLTDGVDATRVRWDTATGMILASATCGEENRSLWSVSPENGSAELFEPSTVFGTERAYGLFDLSQEGRLLVFSRDALTGDIWVSEGPPGTY